MKVYLALLVFSPLLVSSLKLVSKPKETYASYAAKNGIELNKADSDATAGEAATLGQASRRGRS